MDMNRTNTKTTKSTMGPKRVEGILARQAINKQHGSKRSKKALKDALPPLTA